MNPARLLSKLASLIGGDGRLSTKALGTGAVLQVVSTTSTAQPSTTSTTPVSSGISATITPLSTTSKIKIEVSGLYGSTGGWPIVTVLKNGAVMTSNPMIGHQADYSWQNASYSIDLTSFDSPSTTSAITYSIGFYCPNGGTTYINRSSYGNTPGAGAVGTTSITLTEIAG